MPRRSLPGALALMVALLHGPLAAAPSDGGTDGEAAHALLARAYENLYSHDFVQTLRISTRLPGGREMTRRVQIARKQSVSPGRAMVRFLDPPEIRKTAMLLVEHDDRYDDIYLYLPAFRIVRRLSASQRADAFFGTNITYEDLEPKRAEDFEAREIRREAWEDTPCVVVETRARSGIESMYERVESCIEPERAIILWSEFWQKGAARKRSEIDLASVKRVRDYYIPHRAQLVSRDPTMETVLLVESYEASERIADALFSLPNLEFGDAQSDRGKFQAAP